MSDEREYQEDCTETAKLVRDAKLGDPRAEELLFGLYLQRAERFYDLPPGKWTPRAGAEMLLARKCPLSRGKISLYSEVHRWRFTT